MRNVKARKKKKRNVKVKVDLRLYKNLNEKADYNKRFKEQNGVCAICGRPPKTKRLARDHNHLSGKPRGLLCMMCNHKVLGIIEKLKIRPEAIVRYLQRFDPENPLLVQRQNEQANAF